MDLVALSNGLHGSVQMDSVALFSWIGWLRHHGIFSASGSDEFFAEAGAMYVNNPKELMWINMDIYNFMNHIYQMY